MTTLPTPTKLNKALDSRLQAKLPLEDRLFLQACEEKWRFSFQQLKQTGEWLIDVRMWKEPRLLLEAKKLLADLEASPSGEADSLPANPGQIGERLFRRMAKVHAELAGEAKVYPRDGAREDLPRHTFVDKELKGRLLRLCPAASERAVCCNLKTLSIVDNCAMACSYCVLQNHYDEAKIAVPTNLKQKLAEIQLHPDKRYRIGTGEYSDSLLWGNRNDILVDLSAFAERHPNIILELKTKSANVDWLLKNPVPPNVCASWSLNPQVIISNEEHKTAGLERRLMAARAVADKGIKVGFHFHPMFYFSGWEDEYEFLIKRVVSLFRPEEVLWVSLGCVTMMKGFAQELRSKFQSSKLLQMRTETTPDGKITYAFDIREALYRNALQALSPWKGQVFQYLCMEHAPMWNSVMGYDYPNMAAFDDVFNASAFAKIK